jgi:hypothetical protein
MSLTDGELARIKAELGYHLVGVEGVAYVGWNALFETIIQPYLDTGTSTTSATAVTAASTATPVTLTLTSATGLASGDRVVIDVDSRKETVTIQSLSGTSMTVQLSLAHSGTYPVVLADSGEAIVREILTRIRETKAEMATAFGLGSLKRADDLEWYQAGGNLSSQFGTLGENLAHWRGELSATLGVASAWDTGRAASQTLSVY